MKLVFLFLFIAPVMANYVLTCHECVNNSKIYVRLLYQHSPRLYACIRTGRDLNPGDIVTKRACASWDCLLLSQPSDRVYNKSRLCKEKDIENGIDLKNSTCDSSNMTLNARIKMPSKSVLSISLFQVIAQSIFLFNYE